MMRLTSLPLNLWMINRKNRKEIALLSNSTSPGPLYPVRTNLLRNLLRKGWGRSSGRLPNLSRWMRRELNPNLRILPSTLPIRSTYPWISILHRRKMRPSSTSPGKSWRRSGRSLRNLSQWSRKKVNRNLKIRPSTLQILSTYHWT